VHRAETIAASSRRFLSMQSDGHRSNHRGHGIFRWGGYADIALIVIGNDGKRQTSVPMRQLRNAKFPQVSQNAKGRVLMPGLKSKPMEWT